MEMTTVKIYCRFRINQPAVSRVARQGKTIAQEILKNFGLTSRSD